MPGRAPLCWIALLAALWMAPPAAAQAVDDALRERVAEEGRVMVIVELEEPTVPEGWIARRADLDGQRRRVATRQIEAIYELGGTDAGPVRPYAQVPFLAVPVGPEALEALARSPRVRSVRASRVFAPSLAESLEIIQADQAQAIGFDGTGQTVVVLDTGTDGGHQNFPPGKFVDEACFSDGATAGGAPQGGGFGDCPGGGDTAFGPAAAVPCTYAAHCFHGTHVAGIAVGSGPTLPGVAPGASLIPIQIASEFPGSHPSCGGSPCPLSWEHDTDAALSYVYTTLRHSHTIASVNLSLGGAVYTSACDAAFPAKKAIIDNLRSVGIATVIATGNNGCSGVGCTDAISAPSCISSAVSVSATRDETGNPATFANRAPFMTFYAPGQSILAPQYQTVDQYQNSSGTSMAAPHIAGAWALLQQAVPGTSVSSLVSVLEATETYASPGAGRPNLRDALGQLGYPECDDGIDNDGDGAVDTADLGCDDAADLFERSDALACDNGLDDDGDGEIDLADPGCGHPGSIREDPACDDGIDNDGDGGIDWDGSPADPECLSGHITAESPPGCGLGPELVLLLPALAARFRRRKNIS